MNGLFLYSIKDLYMSFSATQNSYIAHEMESFKAALEGILCKFWRFGNQVT